MVGAATLSGHKQTHLCTTSVPVVCSLLHSHTRVGIWRGGVGRISPYLLSAYCLRSCWEKGHMISFWETPFLEKETCITIAKLSEKAGCAEC